MKNKLKYFLLLPLFLLMLNTSYGQNYTTDQVNNILCNRKWRLYSFNPDSTGKFFRFDYAYVMLVEFIPGGKANLNYTDTVLTGSWNWDEPNQLISISTTPDLDPTKTSKFKVREMNKKKCTFEVPGQTGKGSMLYMREGEK